MQRIQFVHKLLCLSESTSVCMKECARECLYVHVSLSNSRLCVGVSLCMCSTSK